MSIREGSCGEIVSHVDLVEKKKVSEESAEKTWVKWLFSERNGALTFAVRVFEIEPGGWIKPHHHPWEHGIFVLEGVGDIRIGSKVYRVTTGSYLYIPPNVEHEYRVVGDKSVKFICIIPIKPSVQENVKKEC